MGYNENMKSNIEEATNGNARKLILAKILKSMGFTEEQIATNFSTNSKRTCSFN